MVDSSEETELLRPETELMIVVISRDLLMGRSRSPTSEVTLDVRVPTTGRDLTSASASEGTLAASASTPPTVEATSGAPNTW